MNGESVSLTFQNFKQLIPSQILERGRSYFRSGHITELEMEDEAIWSAQVAGSEDYDVHIEQTSDGELDCTCTCPYDGGLYCKHIAALLYAIEESFPEYIGKPKRKSSTAKRDNNEDKLQKALSKASHEVLVTTILELAKQDKKIANQLMLRFGAVKEDKATYGKMVKDALRAYKQQGFIDYYASTKAAREVDKLIGQAGQMLAQGAFDAAITFYQAVMENVIEAFDYTDDSNGALGDCLARAVEGLENAATIADSTQRENLFKECLKEAQKPRYSGWEYRWDLLQLSADLIGTPEQRKELFAVLDASSAKAKDRADSFEAAYGRSGMQYVRGDIVSSFDAERSALLKLSVIERQDGEQAAEKFITEHVHLHRFRQLMIERNIKRHDLKAAKQLASEGVEISRKQGYPGLVFQYWQWLLKIAESEKDVDSIIRYARDLLLNGHDTQYYTLLKANVAEAKWASFLKALIKDLQGQHMGQLVNWIYAREGMWSEILEQAKRGWHQAFEPYREELEQHYPNSVAEIYEKTVYKMLETTMGRDTYRRASEYLQRMKRLGKGDRVSSMVDEFKKRYQKRRALISELDAV